jgi:hypothetical protein
MKSFFSVFYDIKVVHEGMFKPIKLYGQVKFEKNRDRKIFNFINFSCPKAGA